MVNPHDPSEPDRGPKALTAIESDHGVDDSQVNTICLFNYVKGDQLGKGSFGTVFKYTRNEGVTVGPMNIAVKEMTYSRENIRELRFAKTLKHRNIIHYYGVKIFETIDACYLMMELAKMSLKQFAKEWKEFSVDDVRHIAVRLTWGLNYIHSRGVIHRDIKPSNIVITWRDSFDPFNPRNISGIIPKWCDFGLSRFFCEGSVEADPPTMSTKGNLKYMAPEVREMLSTGSSWKDGFKPTDIYSLGVVLKKLGSYERHDEVSKESEENKKRLASGLDMMVETDASVRTFATDLMAFYFTVKNALHKQKGVEQLFDLQRAAFQGRTEEVQHLISKGANMEETDIEGHTPLHLATIKGHIDTVKILLECGAKVDPETNDGLTPLIIASSMGLIEMATVLITNGANVNHFGSNGQTPLMVCCLSGNTELAKLLVHHGAEIELASYAGWTPLMCSCVPHPYHRSMDQRSERNNSFLTLALSSAGTSSEATKFLIEQGASLNVSNKNKLTAIMIASMFDNIEVVMLLIAFTKDKDALLDAQDENGSTALMISVQNLHTEIVRILIDAGASVSVTNRNGDTALLIAVQTGNTELVRILIDSGASVGVSNKNGDTLLLAVQTGNVEIVKILIDEGTSVGVSNKNGDSLLLIAVQTGNTELVELLINEGSSVNEVGKNGSSLLTIASLYGHTELVKLLLNKCGLIDNVLGSLKMAGAINAALNAVDNNGDTALIVAVQNNHFETVKLLAEAGACVNVANRIGDTPLIISVQNNQMEISKTLINAGASVKVFNKIGDTPLMIAAQNGNIEIAKLLNDAGASAAAFNRLGMTPLIIARHYGQNEIAKLLTNRSSQVDDDLGALMMWAHGHERYSKNASFMSQIEGLSASQNDQMESTSPQRLNDSALARSNNATECETQKTSSFSNEEAAASDITESVAAELPKEKYYNIMLIKSTRRRRERVMGAQEATAVAMYESEQREEEEARYPIQDEHVEVIEPTSPSDVSVKAFGNDYEIVLESADQIVNPPQDKHAEAIKPLGTRAVSVEGIRKDGKILLGSGDQSVRLETGALPMEVEASSDELVEEEGGAPSRGDQPEAGELAAQIGASPNNAKPRKGLTLMRMAQQVFKLTSVGSKKGCK